MRKSIKSLKSLKNLISFVVVFSLMVTLFSLTGCANGESTTEDPSDNNSDAYDASWVDDSIVPQETGSAKGLENFNTLDLYGNPVDQSIFEDYEITVIDVWGTYCNPCINAMPTLAKIYGEYEPQGVNVIGLIIDVQNGDFVPKKDFIIKAMEITDMTGADFTHLLTSKNLTYSVLKDISAIPASFIVDSEGNLLSEITYGGHSEDQWRELLDGYLKKD